MTTPLTPNEVKVLHAFNFGDVLSASDIFKRGQSSKTFVKYGSIHYCIYRLKERGLITEEGKGRWKLAQRKKSVLKEVKAPAMSTPSEEYVERAYNIPGHPTNGKPEEIEPAMVKKVEQDFNGLQNMLYIGLTRLLVVTIVLLHHLITNASIFS